MNFRQLMTGGKRAPGLPKFDPNRGVSRLHFYYQSELTLICSYDRCMAASRLRFSGHFPQ